ncbi:MAG: hypothetical protein AB7S26_40750 [Sandaracinaceae bacterium]
MTKPSTYGRVKGALALVVLAAVAPNDAAAQSSCPDASAAELLARVPRGERDGLDVDDEGLPSSIVRLDLDGNPGEELVLAVDVLVSELDDEGGDSFSALIAYRCMGGRWAFVGRHSLPIDRGWDGTFDTRPGVVVMREERFARVDHPFLRVEHVDVRGSHDPRFISRRLLLLHMVGGRLIVAFDAFVRVDYVSGPARSDAGSIVRTVVFQRPRAPRIRMRVVDRTDRRPRRCAATFAFDGRTFVGEGDGGCETGGEVGNFE